jgi:hypothetical protein
MKESKDGFSFDEATVACALMLEACRLRHSVSRLLELHNISRTRSLPPSLVMNFYPFGIDFAKSPELILHPSTIAVKN